MGISKSIAFAAPLRSSTFNAGPQSKFAGRNAVVVGGSVTTSLGIATIQPLTWIQEGLFVTADTPLSATIPAGLVAPYFIAVTTSSPVFVPGEVVTPTFVKRPQDMSTGTVLVAEWDGIEWRQLPHVQFDQQIVADELAAVKRDMIGIATGFNVEIDGSDLVVDPGTLTDRQGRLTTKTDTTTIAQLATDIDGLGRVDTLVFRRPDDSSTRAGVIKQVVGQAYDASDLLTTLHNTQIGNTLVLNQVAKTLVVPATNESIFLYIADVGAPSTLVLRASPDLMSTVSVAVNVATDLTYFDAILNPSGSIDIVYTRANSLYYKRVDTAGVDLFAETLLFADVVALLNPKIVSIKSGTGYFLHIVYERTVSGAVHTLHYIRLSAANTVETATQLLVNLSDVVTTPSLDKDDDDALLILAFANSGTNRVYLRTYDASTATGITAPAQIGSSLELQDDTFIISSSLVAPVTGAANPIVKRTDNKDTLVFWRHDKGAGVFGVAYYSPRALAAFGHKAVIVDLTAPAEDIDFLGVIVDGMSTAHFIAALASGDLYSASVRVDTAELVYVPGTLDTAIVVSGVDVAFNAKGSLVHTWAEPGLNETRFAKSTAGVSSNLRSWNVTPTDIYIAQYRTEDAVLAVSGLTHDENPTAQRLMEFMTCLAGGGQISWQIAGANKLVLTAAVPLNFYNRRATYTVPTNGPGGVTVASGQVAFVRVPDEDETQNLVLELADFGDGVLDRANRNIFPLFWNMSGVLYTRFAPFRLSSDGETIILGNSMSQEMLRYLSDEAIPVDSTPDPLAHGYSSITGATLLQSDGHNTAIGKLDAAIDAHHGQCKMTADGTTTRVLVAGANRVLLDGTTLTKEVSDLELNFSGAEIDFDTGDVFEDDGITPLGLNFTPIVVPNGQYAWYSVTLLPNAANGVNEMTAQLLVQPGSATGASPALAPKAAYVKGTKLGMVLVTGTVSGIAFIDQSDIHQLGSGSGSGSGDSDGNGAALQPADGFKALAFDDFDVASASVDSKVEAAPTNGAYSTTQELYQLSCDKTRTVTTVGTAYTLSGAPSFTVQVGDIIWSGTRFRRIDIVTTQTTGALDVAFSPDLTAAACMVAQAVWSKDLVNVGSAVEQTRLRDFYPATAIEQINIAYLDSLIANDAIADQVSVARIVVSACNEGLQASVTTPTTDLFSPIFTRPQAPGQILNYPLIANVNQERLFLCFFPNPNEATVTTTANVLGYEVSVYTEAALQTGGYLDSAFCMTDSSGTPNNCSNPTVVATKTRVQLGFNFVPDINSGKVAGDLHVLLEGQTVPRYYVGVVGAYWKEVIGSTDTIEFHADLSGFSLSIQVERRQGSVDTASQNALRLAALHEAIVGSATQVTLGTATHSTVTAAIADLATDGQLTILKGTYVENVIVTKRLKIQGQSYGTLISGTWTHAASSAFSDVGGMKIGDNIVFDVGANGIFFRHIFLAAGKTVTDNGTANSKMIIQE